jgi:FkbM family methyltransferase
MSAVRRGAVIGTDLACDVIGRRRMVRFSRFVLNRARRDVPSNNVGSDGELSLQRWVLNASRPGQQIQIVDVGANVGQWSSGMLQAASQTGRRDDLDLHAFEPSAYTFECLSRDLANQEVTLNQLAVSDQSGQSVLYVVKPAAGINSLYRSHDAPESTITEHVVMTTLDEYSESAGLKDVALLKIDTEGNDMAVLRGCQKLLSEQRISVVQFEYNRWWIYARAFLRDAFDLLQPLEYRIGKLTPWGIEFYPGWDYELETFIQGNYVAVAPGAVEWVPAVKWWKSCE